MKNNFTFYLTLILASFLFTLKADPSLILAYNASALVDLKTAQTHLQNVKSNDSQKLALEKINLAVSDLHNTRPFDSVKAGHFLPINPKLSDTEHYIEAILCLRHARHSLRSALAPAAVSMVPTSPLEQDIDAAISALKICAEASNPHSLSQNG